MRVSTLYSALRIYGQKPNILDLLRKMTPLRNRQCCVTIDRMLSRKRGCPTMGLPFGTIDSRDSTLHCFNSLLPRSESRYMEGFCL